MWGSSAACQLHAVEEYGEGKQHGEIMHGGEHTLAGREEVPRRKFLVAYLLIIFGKDF